MKPPTAVIISFLALVFPLKKNIYIYFYPSVPSDKISTMKTEVRNKNLKIHTFLCMMLAMGILSWELNAQQF